MQNEIPRILQWGNQASKTCPNSKFKVLYYIMYLFAFLIIERIDNCWLVGRLVGRMVGWMVGWLNWTIKLNPPKKRATIKMFRLYNFFNKTIRIKKFTIRTYLLPVTLPLISKKPIMQCNQIAITFTKKENPFDQGLEFPKTKMQIPPWHRRYKEARWQATDAASEQPAK